MEFSLANQIHRIDSEMNEDLLERLTRSQPKAQNEDGGESMVSDARHIDGIREYFDKANNLPTDHSWLTLPELPTSVEVGRLKKGKPTVGEIPVPVNKVDGPWSSKQEYLQSHYELLREDGVASLREAVEEIRAKPELMEKDSQEHAAIYENVGRLSLHPVFALTDLGIHFGRDICSTRYCCESRVLVEASRKDDSLGAIEETDLRNTCGVDTGCRYVCNGM